MKPLIRGHSARSSCIINQNASGLISIRDVKDSVLIIKSLRSRASPTESMPATYLGRPETSLAAGLSLTSMIYGHFHHV